MGRAKNAVQFLKLIKDADDITAIEEEYKLTFLRMDDLDDDADLALDQFLDALGDLGVGEYANSKPSDLLQLLGVKCDNPDEVDADSTKEPTFPFMNPLISENGVLPEDIPGYWDYTLPDDLQRAYEEHALSRLTSMWHQKVGVCAIADRCLSGRNTILADAVGFGKTFICYMTMACLRITCLSSDRSEGRPPICE